MDAHLDQLRRQLAQPLDHPDRGALDNMSAEVVSWIVQHYTSLPDQPVTRGASRPQMEALLREPPPEQGQGFDRVFADFQHSVAPYAFRINHPRFLAFIPGAPSFPSILGDLLCSGTNFFAGVWLEAAGPTQVEILVLDWFKEFVGYPPAAQGLLTSGGSEATLTALVAARERLPLAERPRAILYVTEQRHWSVDRAAKVMGLLPDQLRPVPASASFRLDAAALMDCIGRDRAAGLLPWAVVANAGATSTGTVDPLADLASLCRRERLWLHVDAAYGWPIVLVPEGRAVRDGICQADSVTLDPHKWFGQAFEAGCLLIRDGALLTETFALRPDYMQDVAPAVDEVNFCDQGIALTRRFRALKIWFSVKMLGVAWFRSLVERGCQLAELAEALLRASPHFEVLSARQLSIVCFRYRPDDRDASDQELDRLNLALVDELRVSGRAFLSSTQLRQRVSLRVCFVNWRTTAGDVEAIVQLLTELGAKACGKCP